MDEEEIDVHELHMLSLILGDHSHDEHFCALNILTDVISELDPVIQRQIIRSLREKLLEQDVDTMWHAGAIRAMDFVADVIDESDKEENYEM